MVIGLYFFLLFYSAEGHLAADDEEGLTESSRVEMGMNY